MMYLKLISLLTIGILLILDDRFLMLKPRGKGAAFALQSTSATTSSANARTSSPHLLFQYTHLEANGMLWQVPEAEISLVVDPIASQLDFGIPWGYRGNKKVLTESETLDTITRAAPTHCLLSQGLDDHTHLPTLTKLIRRLPQLKFVVAPSAANKIAPLVSPARITVLSPGDSLALLGDPSSSSSQLIATEGALVGPPWQARENGWLLRVAVSDSTTITTTTTTYSIYAEPHGDVTDRTLRNLPPVDVVISPVQQQSLPAQVPVQYTIVYGSDRTAEIVRQLKASVVIPLGNGGLDTQGPLAKLVQSSPSKGSGVDELARLLQLNPGRLCHVRVERPTPGVPLSVIVQKRAV